MLRKNRSCRKSSISTAACDASRCLALTSRLKALGEKRPAVEAIPFLVDIRGDGELGLAFLQELDDFPGRAAQQLQFQPFEQAVELEQEGVSNSRLIVRDTPSLSVPTSPLLIADASDLAPSALS